MNSGGASFSLDKAVLLRAVLRGGLPKYSSVIVSADWQPGSGRFSKATVYAVTERPLGSPVPSELASLAGDSSAWTGPASARDMGFLGADFYRSGKVEFKVYRRYPPGRAGLEAAAMKAGKKIGEACAVGSVHRVLKFNRVSGRVFLDKTHFRLGGAIKPGELAAAGGAPARRAAALFERRAGAFSKATYAGIKPGGGGFEIYFG
jgi:hypothetical protein